MMLQLIITGVIAACLGSFGGMLVYRLINNKPFFKGEANRSYCPSCNYNIDWKHNIPILSYIILKGKCFSCGCKISKHYFLIEIVTVLLFVVVSNLIGFSQPLYLFSSLFFIFILIIISATDIMSGYIYNSVVNTGIFVGLSLSFILPIGWENSFSGAFIGYFAPWLINKINKYITKSDRDGIGDGDFLVAALIGSFLGYEGVLASFVYGPIMLVLNVFTMKMFGKIDKIRRVEFSFGQYLSSGAILYFLLLMNGFRLTDVL